MDWKKKSLFYSTLALIPLIVINAVAMVAIQLGTGVNPLSRHRYAAHKAGYVKFEMPMIFPHPYFGPGMAGNAAAQARSSRPHREKHA